MSGFGASPQSGVPEMTAGEFLRINYEQLTCHEYRNLDEARTEFIYLKVWDTSLQRILWDFYSIFQEAHNAYPQDFDYKARLALLVLWFRGEVFRINSTFMAPQAEEASQGAPAATRVPTSDPDVLQAGQGAPLPNTVPRTSTPEEAMARAEEEIRKFQELLASRGGAAQAAAPQAAAQQAAAQQAARPQSRDECQLCSDQLTPENALYLPDGTCPHPLACKSCAPTVLRNLEDANLDLRNEKVHMKCSYCRSSFWIQSFKDGSPNGTRAIDVWNSYEPRAEDRLPQRPRQEQPRTVGNSNEAQLHLRTNYFSHLQYHRQVEALDPYKNLTLDEAEESINADLQQEDPTAAWSGLDDASRARLMDAVIQKRRGDTAVIFVNRRRNRVVRWPNDVMDLTQDVLNVDP